MIIDAHAHAGRHVGIWPEANPAPRMAAAAKRLGVGKLLISSLGTDGFVELPSADDVRTANRYTAEAVEADDVFAGMVYCSPEHPELSLEEMRRYIADGPFVGVKLWIAGKADHPGCDPILDYAAELGVPVLQHAWWKTVGGYAGESTPADVARAARRHPGTTIQMAHLFGSGERGVDDIAGCPNVVIDTCGSEAEAGLVAYALSVLGPERVLYGSDAAGRDMAVQLSKLAAIDVDPSVLDAVLSGNARRLYTRLGEVVDAASPAPRAGSAIDVSAFVGHWPFRPVPGSGAAELSTMLRRAGVGHAYVSPLAAELQPATGLANAEVAAAIEGDDFFSFVPVLNPAYSEAIAGLDRWPQAKGVRIMPGAHGYPVGDAVGLATEVARRGLPLFVTMRMRDQRISHPRFVIDEPPVADVLALADAVDGLRVVVTGARTAEIVQLVRGGHGRVWCEISHADSQDPVRYLVDQGVTSGLLAGTHAPLLVPEALGARLVDAGLSATDLAALTSGNARAAGLA